jgi:nitronate monooxygenase
VALKTPLTELLEIRHPVILAPMAWVSGGALAAAVSAAGGLGLIGGGYGEAEWIEAEFAAAGNQRIGIGFITWRLAETPALLDLALARSPAAVMLSFGDPAPFAAKIKEAGAKLICQVQSIAQARAAAAAGADLIVAQGGEAGGHGAARATLPLVPAVVDAVDPLPVAAAGGIADGRGLAAALMLGAAGVLLGTRFYAAAESLGHPDAKRRILAASGDDTVATSVFDTARNLAWPVRYRIRGLANAFTARWHGNERALGEAGAGERQRYEEAAAQGDFDLAGVIAGEAVGLIGEVLPAGEIVERLVADAVSRLEAAAGWRRR